MPAWHEKGYCPYHYTPLTYMGDEPTCVDCTLESINVATQVAEDTCEEHNVFCCDVCFNISERR